MSKPIRGRAKGILGRRVRGIGIYIFRRRRKWDIQNTFPRIVLTTPKRLICNSSHEPMRNLQSFSQIRDIYYVRRASHVRVRLTGFTTSGTKKCDTYKHTFRYISRLDVKIKHFTLWVFNNFHNLLNLSQRDYLHQYYLFFMARINVVLILSMTQIIPITKVEIKLLKLMIVIYNII